MSNDEKLQEISKRLKSMGYELEPVYITTLSIIGYLNDLSELGLVTTEFTMTDSGKNVKAVCEEFAWMPSDNDIKRFVAEMVDPNDQEAFEFLLKRYRDDGNEFIEKFNQFKKEMGENPEKSDES